MAMTEKGLEQNGISPSTPRVTNGYKVEFRRWGTDPDLLNSLQKRAAADDQKFFGLGPLEIANEIYHHMRWDPQYRRSITFATLYGRDVGFCIQEFIVVPLLDGSTKSVVWTALRAVDKKHQDEGVGTALLLKGYEEYSNLNPDYYGGRSQVEPVYGSLYSSNLFSEILALDGPFKGRQREVVRYLASQVMYPRPVDDRTGLVKGAYPEGETGGYTLDLDRSPRIRWIHERFDELGVVKKEGDALIYLAIPKSKMV